MSALSGYVFITTLLTNWICYQNYTCIGYSVDNIHGYIINCVQTINISAITICNPYCNVTAYNNYVVTTPDCDVTATNTIKTTITTTTTTLQTTLQDILQDTLILDYGPFYIMLFSSILILLSVIGLFVGYGIYVKMYRYREDPIV